MAYLALYRKYRPRRFDDVVGQEYVTQILKNQILSGRVGHAYLFSGIRGTGKTSIAKIFARAVNCEATEDGNPCGHCDTCQNIEKPGISDIIEIDAASNRGVDEIREIREKVKFPPTLGKYKVYIIDEVHMLTKEAFNALLKTLEEPPSHVIFILATTEPNKLPATILSRCQRFDIRPITTEAIAGQIDKILKDTGVAMEADAVAVVAARGDHSMRDALSLLDQIIDIREGDAPITKAAVLRFLGMADNEEILTITEGIIREDAAAVITAFNTMMQKGLDPALILNQLMAHFRALLMVLTTGEAASQILGLPAENISALKAQAEQLGEKRLFGMVDFMIEERPKLAQSGLGQIVAEMTLLRLIRPDGWCKKSTLVEAELPENNVADRGMNVGQSAPSYAKRAPRPAAAPGYMASPQPERPYAPAKADAISSAQKAEQPAAGQRDSQPAETPVPPASTLSAEGAKASVAADGESPQKMANGALNVDDLYRTMMAACQTKKPVALIALRKARLALTGERSLTLCLNPDDQAGLSLLKQPTVYGFLQKVVKQAAGADVSLSVEAVKKTYETMSMLEKTREIVNNQSVEIIEVE